MLPRLATLFLLSSTLRTTSRRLNPIPAKTSLYTLTNKVYPAMDEPKMSTPAVYQRISIQNSEDVHRLYPIMASYITQPHLADSVTEMVINGDCWPSASWGYHYTVPEEKKAIDVIPTDTHQAIVEYTRKLTGLGVQHLASMERALEWRKQESMKEIARLDRDYYKERSNFALAATAILLSMCKNIATLYFGEMADYDNSSLRDFILKSNYGLVSNPGLQKLERLEVLTEGYSSPALEFSKVFQNVHRLPALRSIFIDGTQEYQSHHYIGIPRTSNMKELTITHCDISSSWLDMLIAVPRALESLKISIGGVIGTDGGVPNMNNRRIGKRLWAQHRNTLKALDLDLSVTSETCTLNKSDEQDGDEKAEETDEEYDGEYYGPEYLAMDLALSTPLPDEVLASKRKYGVTIGSLRDFQALTYLSISVLTLIGHSPPFRLIDALPPSLEQLRLYGYTRGQNADVDNHIDEFLMRKNEVLPNLKEVLGIESVIPDMNMIFGDEPGEDDIYEGIERNLDWIVAGENSEE